ncbi:MAG: alkaline phosphatase family protein [bacterium]|nr:alkaline phosphatase family protein [bacterium]
MSAQMLGFLFATGLCAGACGTQTTAEPEGSVAASVGEPPRLVVLCSVDQLASWVLAAGRPFLAPDGGFARLARDGVEFTNCVYEHACSETGPGHATIGTGAPARVHGIVRNRWWSREVGASIYCVGEPMRALPGMPEGANRGPGQLLAPTLAATMRANVPGCRITSVAWKDRSAILMCGGDSDVAAWFEKSTGRLVTNTKWVSSAPDWLARFNTEAAIDRFFGRQWQRIGPDAAYEGLVDDRAYEYPHENGSKSRTLPQPLTGGGTAPSPGYYEQIYRSPFGNEVVRLAAQAAVAGMELGSDDIPDLLAVSFSSTDVVGHYFGSDSVEARDALLRLDREVAALLEFLDERVGRGKYAFFLTADHGVGPTPEWAKANGLAAGRGLLQTQARAAAERDLRRKFGKEPVGQRYCQHVGEWALVLNRAAFSGNAAEVDAKLVAAAEVAARAAGNVRGIATAYTTREILAEPRGEDPIRQALHAALHPDRAGDVQLVVEPYWLDGTLPSSHGTPHPYDREVVAFAFGSGLPSGITVDDLVRPGLGAVLFARLLGIPAPARATARVPAALGVTR